ncbi:MAG: acyltransferase family protein [Methylophilaceae bacterium]
MTDDVAMSKSAWQKAFSLSANFQSIYQRRASNFAPIDGIRALSIILVLVYHTFLVYDIANPNETVASIMVHLGGAWTWAWNGDKGVDVFFVMSGFLISGILFKQYTKEGHLNLKNFYIRRYLRLTPAYYFMLTIYWLLSANNSNAIWANYLYVSNFLDYQHQAAGWTWSLAVEEQFYFIYPLILMAVFKWAKHLGWVLLALLFASIAVNTALVLNDELLRTTPSSVIYSYGDFYHHFFTVLYDDLYTRFGGLVVGCLAAYAMHFHQAKLAQVTNSNFGLAMTLLGVSLVVFFMAFPAFSHEYDAYQTLHVLYYIFNHTLFALGVGILIIAMLLQQHLIANVFRWFFSLSFWYPIASLSYSLYLIHLVVMVIVIPAILHLTISMPVAYPWSMGQILLYGFIMSTLLSLAISALMYLLIEKPIMNLRR